MTQTTAPVAGLFTKVDGRQYKLVKVYGPGRFTEAKTFRTYELHRVWISK